MRYYHSAIYGVWPRDGETNRLKTRLELCQFLIARHDTSGAEAELIAFAAEIPNEGGGTLDEQAGELFLTVGDANRALVEFRRALAAPHPPAGSLRGAGLAAFQLGDYFQAERYLDRASRIRKDDPMVSQSLTMSRLVLCGTRMQLVSAPRNAPIALVTTSSRHSRACNRALDRMM